MSAHAQYAPSSSATWLECSWSARNAVPDAPRKQETVEAAATGTNVHDAIATSFYFNELPPTDVPEYRAVKLVNDFVEQLEPGEMHIERPVRLNDECWGTPDLYNRAPVISTILDYKNGVWDVYAYHNAQCLSYAAMVLDTDPAEWFRCAIVQPNGLDDNPFRQWLAHRSEVEAHKRKIIAALADRSAPKPGTHCRWCRAFQQCPAMLQDANFVMGALSRSVDQLTPDELVRLLRIMRALADMKPAYDEALTTRLKLGQHAKEATLGPGRTFRSWNDDTQAIMHLYGTYGPKGVKPISPAQAEKLGPAGKQYAAVGAHKPEPELKAKY